MSESSAAGDRPPARGGRPGRAGGSDRGGRPERGGDGPRGDARTRGGRPDRPGAGKRDAAGERTGVKRDRFTNVDAARQVAFDVLKAVAQEDAYANLALPKALRERRVSGRDAGFATELTYGVLRGRGSYDALIATVIDRPLEDLDPGVLDTLRMGAHQLLAMRVPDHAAVATSVAIARSELGTGPSGLVNAVLRRVAGHELGSWLDEVAPPEETDADGHFSVRYSHPEWVVRSLREALRAHGHDPAELRELLAADNEPAAVALSALPGLTSVEELTAPHSAVDVRAGRWSPTGAVLRHGDPGKVPAVRDGKARVQDEGSQLVAHLLARAEVEGRDERWLDLCAGPGGKAALLAALAVQRGAHLTAVEIAGHRAELVRDSLRAVPEGAGGPVEVRVTDGRQVGDDEPGHYDRVLVDAPCTGLGALRRRPEARWRRRPSDLGGLGPLQRSLLASALDAVRPGGVVAYATCSPVLAETRLVVDDVLKAAARKGQGVERLDTPAVLAQVADVPGAAAGTSVQLWPHTHGTDAMHVALLRRTS
ncbi:RsmB/NOP family class I SAM-dependent RNA methyltransferase [Kineococcus rubinsiae]|uniref:RsmB/NOP family class I SAM-dependent RNA methyltransferase n=1 Tax=Kineococcus rubinsiae TaxID=2609562 RepID=UPI00142FF221|nr:transcription antitermination factor NusB [Kineococcus rubinsiae]NIZ89919.1 rRNA small subunit methyltransferase B [Kineococcus rubinsiae]